MRSYPVQYRITRIPAHLKNKQSYCVSKVKELCNSHYYKPYDKLSVNPNDEILKLKIKDEFADVLKNIDKEHRRLIIEEMQAQKQMDIIVLDSKDNNSIQNLAIKLVNASLLEVEKLKKIIVFIG